MPPEVWAYKSMGLDGPLPPSYPGYADYQKTVQAATFIQNSSHTSPGAFGYILSQIQPKPRLTVATHFPVADDTVTSAFESVKGHCPDVQMGRDIVWSFDLMVLRVFPDRIEQCRADVSKFAFLPPPRVLSGLTAPKYHDAAGNPDPYAQIDVSTEIKSTNPDGSVNFRVDGY